MIGRNIFTVTLMSLFFVFTGFDAYGGEYKAVKRSSKVGKEINAVYQKALNLTKKEDLNGLMNLYSTKFLSNGKSRADLKKSWEKIFSNFNDIDIEHHIYKVFVAENKAKMVCGGVFLGMPAMPHDMELDETFHDPEIIDSWREATHHLVKENGGWKFLGNQVSYNTGTETGPIY